MLVFFSIDGNIGIGKSTLLERLQQDPRLCRIIHTVPERIDVWLESGLFERFRENPPQFYTPFQLMVGLTTLLGHLTVPNDKPLVVMERSIQSIQNIFMPLQQPTKSQMEFLTDAFQPYLNHVRIDHKIFISGPPELAKRGIEQRNRPGEENIYMSTLSKIEDLQAMWMLREIAAGAENLYINLEQNFISDTEYERIVNFILSKIE